MELVLKTAANKTPFIGIWIYDENSLPGSSTYNKDAIYDIDVFLKKDSVMLILLLNGTRISTYENLKFLTPMAFESFLKADRPKGIFKFGYVHWSIYEQKYILTKPPFILKVQRVTLFR